MSWWRSTIKMIGPLVVFTFINTICANIMPKKTIEKILKQLFHSWCFLIHQRHKISMEWNSSPSPHILSNFQIRIFEKYLWNWCVQHHHYKFVCTIVHFLNCFFLDTFNARNYSLYSCCKKFKLWLFGLIFYLKILLMGLL